MKLYEKYRPKRYEDVIGQSKAVDKIAQIRKSNGATLAGECFWITGATGTGKTTLARIMAAEVSTGFYTRELDGTALTIGDLRHIEDDWRYRPIGCKAHALIINEGHGFTATVSRYLLTMVERMPEYAIVIVTTTNDGEDMLFDKTDDARPLVGRFHNIQLARRDLAEVFAEAALRIAQAEQLDGNKNIADFIKLVRKCQNSMREVIVSIGDGVMVS